MGKGLSPQQRMALQELVEFNIEEEDSRVASFDRTVEWCERNLKTAHREFDQADKYEPGVPTVLGFAWYKTQADKDEAMAKRLAAIDAAEVKLQEALNPPDLVLHWTTFAYLLHRLEPELPLRERQYGGVSRWDAHLFVAGTPGLESKQSSLRRTLKRLEKRGLVSIPRTGNVKLTLLGWETAQEMGMW